MQILRLMLLTSCAALLCAQSPFSFREVNSASLELSESGKPVYVYNFGMILKDGFPETMRRSTYLHPVYTPGGTVITDDFNPPDHSWQRGIWWAWPVVEVGGQKYDMWAVGEWTAGEMRQKFVRWTARETAATFALLGVENGWYIGDRRVMKELVEIRATPTDHGVRHLDFKLQFEPTDEPVEIAGSPEIVKNSSGRKKGFGGFSIRFAPRDGGAAKTIIRTENGIAEKDDNFGVYRWAQLEGMYSGHPAVGRIEDDSSNPGYPSTWQIRHGFGYLNPYYPGPPHVRIERGKPLTLRYRVTLWDGVGSE